MNSLTKRALVGFIRFQIILGILLFLPAWSFRYWQAWVYLLLFSGSGLWLTHYFLKRDPALIERRLNVGPKAEKETSQKIIQGAAAVFVLALYAVAGFDRHFHWSHVSIPWGLAGEVGVLLGIWIIFLVFRENSFAAATIQVETSQRVISSGPYGCVRHPMYSGSLLGFFAAAPALGSWWAMVPAFLLSALLVVRLVL